MTKAENILYSPGKIIILWQLIFLVSQNEGVGIQDILSVIKETGILGGKFPTDDSLKLAQYCRFIVLDKGNVYLTDECKDALLPLCSSQNPNINIIRSIVQKIISLSVYSFHWLLFFNTDVDVFKAAIPDDWIELLDGAALFDFDRDDVLDWWNAILESVNNFDISNTKEIGDIGEKLTVEYEKNRLLADSIKNAQHYVMWMSRFSDKYGYDISSIRGKRFRGKSSLKAKLQLEVKSSVVSNGANFRFRVSKNEWNTALEKLESYFFYCWVGVDRETKTAEGPFVIPAEKLKPYFPEDKGSICEWTECRFDLDLAKYSS